MMLEFLHIIMIATVKWHQIECCH